MLLPLTAPLPNNTLTPVPQSWVDSANARINSLELRAQYAKALTSCFTPAGGFTDSVGPFTAAEVLQSQVSSPQVASGLAGATIPSSSGMVSAVGTNPTTAAISSNPMLTAPPISRPAPVVVPYNSVSLAAPGLPAPNGKPDCPGGQTVALTYQQRMNAPPPKMLMPKFFPSTDQGPLIEPRSLGDYAAAWGSARRGVACRSDNGMNWGGLAIALVVGLGVLAVME